MLRRLLAALPVAGLVLALAACGSSPSASPITTDPPAVAGPGIVVTTESGLEYAFDVTSCASPGTNVINLKGSGPAGEFSMAASVQGGFRITGPTAIEATVDEVEVADDGSVTASGTLALADAPDVVVPFQLRAGPGSCE